jgi:uncharacterized protein YjbI with pentapeptide repeats
MAGRILRVTGTVLVIAVALVTPVLAKSTPASADTVVDGCTIVSNPSPTHFTDCPNASFAGANLSYADLAGAQFVDCIHPGYCASASVQGANLTNANLSSTTLAECVFFQAFVCAAADFNDAVMPGANLSFANVQNGAMVSADLAGANLTGTNLGGANLGLADLSDSNLTDAGLSSQVSPLDQTVYVSMNGANVTGTLLVPSDQSVTATSQAGAVATWPTPPAIPGATPGSCTPASGSTFPLFSTTVTCQVLDHANDVATGTFQVNVAPTTQHFTRVLVPSDGAVLAGVPYLDAAAGDSPGVTKVIFEVSGGTLHNQVVATATPTLFGWVAKWNTTTVPNGAYTFESVATDADNNTDTSAPITVTVDNQPPVTAVLIPSNGATVSGATALLDASASSAAGIASVTFEVSGGALSDKVVATATPTYYGWLAQWNTTAVPNGTYSLQSVATDTVNETTTSSPITVTVDNPAPTTTVLIPSNGATQSGTAELLDASASANVTSVKYELTGGALTDQVISTARPTYYGWLGQWNTTTVPNGTYTLQSVAAYAGGVTGTSPGITVTVANQGLTDLANSSFTVTTSDVGSGCGLVHLTFDAVYPGSAAVGSVTLHMAGCVSGAPFTYAGSFTITTGVGTLSGSATGPVTVQIIGGMLEQSYQINLSVTTATGSFTGTTGSLLFSASSQTAVASLTVE